MLCGGKCPDTDLNLQLDKLRVGRCRAYQGCAPHGGRVRRVKVTMLLCDSAQVAGEKLYILGGGWSIVGPDPAPSAIAMKFDVAWHETDIPHHWELHLEDADGRPVMIDTPDGSHPLEGRGDFQVARPAMAPEGTPADVAMAINLMPLQLAPGNRYIWRLTIDGESHEDWALSFTVRPRPED